MSTAPPQFFPNAHDFILNDPVMQIVQGDLNQYNSDTDAIELNALVSVQNGAGYNMTKTCLSDTRSEILGDIRNWAHNPDVNTPRIFWLHGSAGTGKSAIAHTIAVEFDGKEELGSFFPFDHTYLSDRRHEKVFSTIARDLSARNPAFRRELVDAIRSKPWLKSTPDIIQQWETLLVKPAVHLSNDGLILLVVEALDESGDTDSRRHLLSILARRAGELPPNFRILLTSRTLHDISQALEDSVHILRKDITDIPKSSIDRDISTYISTRLAGIDDSFFDKGRLLVLVDLSEGLFQWAFVACEFIKGTGKISKPEKQFAKLTKSATSISLTRLDGLYDTILRSIIPDDDDDGIQLFCSVMSQILGLFEPLSLDALTALRKHFPGAGSDDDNDISIVVKQMGSLLSGITDHSIPIRPLHSSFRDYLVDQSRSKAFHVDISIHRNDLAFATVEVMNTELHFNICKLESSYLLNSDTPDLEKRLKQHISSQLSYSSHHWSSHIQQTSFDPKIAARIWQFLDHYFLFWVEVLSLTKSMYTAALSLSSIISWVDSHQESQNIIDFATDGQRFVRMFGGMIAQSTPHLYLSAISFAPESSIICRRFAPEYPRAVSVALGRITSWPIYQSVLAGHSEGVTSVGFSPDGMHIISGSADATIRIWDAETGEALSAPLEGHIDEVASVAFSPDGKLIISGSMDLTIRIWDANTGGLVGAPLTGHTSGVTCVAFSPDGKRVVSGSRDTTVRIWDPATGQSQLVEGHTSGVTTVAFSPDGERIISGSNDSTIRIWDVKTGAVLAGPFEGHRSGITSIALSPDGTYIVSGSWDCTIRLWDARLGIAGVSTLDSGCRGINSVAFSPDGEHVISGSNNGTICIWSPLTGQLVAAPDLEGHMSGVTSVAFSPDGKRIVSGSRDQTIRIWDTETAKSVAVLEIQAAALSNTVIPGWVGTTAPIGPIQWHTGEVTSVAFSPDGKHVISSSSDKTIRIWNAHTGRLMAAPLGGHSMTVNSVAFSPNGKHIISGSDDETIRIWDFETGNLVGAPLKGHTSYVLAVAISADGKYIISGARDNTIRIWDAKTGESVGSPIEGHLSAVSSVAFSADGRRIVSGSYERTVRVWDIKTGKPAAHVFPKVADEKHSAAVMSVAFSPDGRGIISGSYDFTVRIWDGETGDVVPVPLRGHTGSVNSVAFSPDGRRMASGSTDKTIRIWNAETSETATILRGHTSAVTCVAFSPDGKQIISGSDGGAIRIWDVDMDNVPAKTGAPKFCFSSNPNHTLRDVLSLFKDVSIAGDWRDFIELRQDGWVVGPQGRLLLYVPHMHLSGLFHPRNKFVISRTAIELDLSHFAHGLLWQSCRGQ